MIAYAIAGAFLSAALLSPHVHPGGAARRRPPHRRRARRVTWTCPRRRRSAAVRAFAVIQCREDQRSRVVTECRPCVSTGSACRTAEASAARRSNLLLLASALWIGGAETVIRHLAEGIDRRRFNVTVCVLKQRGHIGDELVRAGHRHRRASRCASRASTT